GAGRPGLVPAAGAGRPRLRRAGRGRRGRRLEPDARALDGRLAGARPGRRHRGRRGRRRGPRAGPVPPAGHEGPAAGDPPVHPGAEGRGAAANVTREHGVEGLAAARLWAASKFPYLATGLFGAEVSADPELTAGWSVPQLGSVLVHHVCHLLRTHGERAQGAGVRPDEAGDWIRAADAEINDDVIPAGLELPGQPVLPRDLGADDGLLAEQYFAGIRRPAPSAGVGETGEAGKKGGARGDGGASRGRGAGTQPRSSSKGLGETAGTWLDCGSGA